MCFCPYCLPLITLTYLLHTLQALHAARKASLLYTIYSTFIIPLENYIIIVYIYFYIISCKNARCLLVASSGVYDATYIASYHCATSIYLFQSFPPSFFFSIFQINRSVARDKVASSEIEASSEAIVIAVERQKKIHIEREQKLRMTLWALSGACSLYRRIITREVVR